MKWVKFVFFVHVFLSTSETVQKIYFLRKGYKTIFAAYFKRQTQIQLINL